MFINNPVPFIPAPAFHCYHFLSSA